MFVFSSSRPTGTPITYYPPRQLHIGQPAVSKVIAQLEERLGVRLLLRSTHGLPVTESGQNFYEHAKRSIEEADEADLAARGTGANLSGRLPT